MESVREITVELEKVRDMDNAAFVMLLCDILAKDGVMVTTRRTNDTKWTLSVDFLKHDKRIVEEYEKQGEVKPDEHHGGQLPEKWSNRGDYGSGKSIF